MWITSDKDITKLYGFQWRDGDRLIVSGATDYLLFDKVLDRLMIARKPDFSYEDMWRSYSWRIEFVA